jgi:hypothetical protein
MWQGTKAVGRGAMHVGRGALGFDAKAGAGLSGRILTGAGAIGGAVAPVAAGALQMSNTGRAVTASLREMGHVHNMQKHAEHGVLHKALHVAPYLGWAGSHLLEDTAVGKKHPWLPKAISTASYLGLAGNAAHDAYTNPQRASHRGRRRRRTYGNARGRRCTLAPPSDSRPLTLGKSNGNLSHRCHKEPRHVELSKAPRRAHARQRDLRRGSPG